MRTITLIILATMTLFGNSFKNKNHSGPEQETNCFSKENFEKVCNYIEKQIEINSSEFFLFENHEIYFNKEAKVITLKKKGYTDSKITEKGVFSLNKSRKGNEKMVKEANRVFCKLYQLSIAG